MNNEILNKLGEILNPGTLNPAFPSVAEQLGIIPGFVKDISVHHLPSNQVDSTQIPFNHDAFQMPLRSLEMPPVSEATARVDKSDIHHQTTDFLSFIDREFQDHADQLRHRACMMRARANEFDDMADGLGINRDLLTRDTLRAVEDFDKTVRWLLEHAHIKPERT